MVCYHPCLNLEFSWLSFNYYNTQINMLRATQYINHVLLDDLIDHELVSVMLVLI
jgi:hypothetical protein